MTADGLADAGDTVNHIRSADCAASHDAEVLAVHNFDTNEAANYDNSTASMLCQQAVTEAGKIDVVTGLINVIGLTDASHPSSGDKLACVAFNSDGTVLTEPLTS